MARKNGQIGAESPSRRSIGRLRADLVPGSSPKGLRAGIGSICAWGCFRIFGPGPRRVVMAAAKASRLAPPRSSVYCSCGRSPIPRVHDDG